MICTGWPKKVSHCQIIKKLCKIVLKSAIEIRFLRKIKEVINHHNIVVGIHLCLTYILTSITMPDLQSSDMRHIR